MFRHILRNGGLVFGGKTLAGFLGLAYLSLAGHALGASDLGALVILHSLTIAFREVLSFKSWQALIRYGANYLEQLDHLQFERIVRLSVALDIVGMVLAAVASAASLHWFGDLLGLPESLQPVATLYCLSTLIALKSTPVGILRLFGRFDLLARQVLVVPLVRLSGVALCWALALPLTAYIIVWFVADVATNILLVVMGRKVLSDQPIGAGTRLAPSLKGYRSHPGINGFLINTNLHGTVGMATTHLPVLLAGSILGPAAAALVKVAQELAAGLAKPGQLLGEAAYPELSRLVAREHKSAMSALKKRALLSGTLTSVVLLAVIFLFGDSLLTTLFGEEYTSAHGLLGWLALAGGIQLTVFLLEPLLFAAGWPGSVLLVRLFAAVSQLTWMTAHLQSNSINAVGQAAVIGALIAALSFVALDKFQGSRPIPTATNV